MTGVSSGDFDRHPRRVDGPKRVKPRKRGGTGNVNAWTPDEPLFQRPLGVAPKGGE
ncbi:hypothetical protein ACLUWO_05040 [Pseudoscardovia radai]|uniref:hypothetical protein n=1 Tax=Pseudoscardovia radai TaxID=987066 RepID=UPI0039958CD6